MEQEKIVPHPSDVTATSSVHEVFHEKGVPEEEPDIDMLAGIKSDLVSFLEIDRLTQIIDQRGYRELSRRRLP